MTQAPMESKRASHVNNSSFIPADQSIMSTTPKRAFRSKLNSSGITLNGRHYKRNIISDNINAFSSLDRTFINATLQSPIPKPNIKKF